MSKIFDNIEAGSYDGGFFEHEESIAQLWEWAESLQDFLLQGQVEEKI